MSKDFNFSHSSLQALFLAASLQFVIQNLSRYILMLHHNLFTAEPLDSTEWSRVISPAGGSVSFQNCEEFW